MIDRYISPHEIIIYSKFFGCFGIFPVHFAKESKYVQGRYDPGLAIRSASRWRYRSSSPFGLTHFSSL